MTDEQADPPASGPAAAAPASRPPETPPAVVAQPTTAAASTTEPAAAPSPRSTTAGEPPSASRAEVAPNVSAGNFREGLRESEKTRAATSETKENAEPAKAADDTSIFLHVFSGTTQDRHPQPVDELLGRQITRAELRDRLRVVTQGWREAKEQQDADALRRIGRVFVLPSEAEGVTVAIAAALCGTPAARYIKLDSTFKPGVQGSLSSTIEDFVRGRPEAGLIVDARDAAKHRPFWDLNKSLGPSRAASDNAGVQVVLIVAGKDLRQAPPGVEDWTQLASSFKDIDSEIVAALAAEEDDRLNRDPAKSELRRCLSQPTMIQELWENLARGELAAFVEELQKGFETSRAGGREALFRETVIHPETRNPAQATALFLGSFVPGLKRQTFLTAHQHLHLIAGSQWRPRKKDKDGEIERWESQPSDFDREHVGVTFESDRSDAALRARIGGPAAVEHFKSLFARTGADALRLFVETGLTTFPLLATNDEKALSGLTALTEEKLRHEHTLPLSQGAVRAEVLALALTQTPQGLDDDQVRAVLAAAPVYLSVIAERLPVSETALPKSPGGHATQALKCLLDDVLELARRLELLENGADWLHDLIARMAFMAPESRWRMVFSEVYEQQARLRQRALLTDRFWRITIDAVRDRADTLRLALIEAAQLVAQPGEVEHKKFRVQIFSRLLTVWLFSVAETISERNFSASPERAASPLLDDGLVGKLGGALASQDFTTLHRQLIEIEYDVVLRTRGSQPDAAVLERLNHERVIRSTCLAALHVLLPLQLLDEAGGAFLNRFAACVDQGEALGGTYGSHGFFSSLRWGPGSEGADGLEPEVAATRFAKGVRRWLAAMPLVVLLAERDLSDQPTPLSEILSRAPRPKDLARDWGQLIDALRPDLLCGGEALKIAPRELRMKCEAYLKQRMSQLAALRSDLVAAFRGELSGGRQAAP